MKKSISLQLLLFSLFVWGCNDDDSNNVVPAPKVSIESGDVSVNSIEFTITPENAAKCSYSILKSDELVPSAEDIIENGTSISVTEPTKVKKEGLDASTKYIVAAAASSTDGQLASTQVEITTAEDPGIVLDRGSAKVYGDRNVGVTLRGNDSGIDYEISLDLYDDSYSVANHLSEGIYTVSEGTEDGALNTEFSYLQRDNDQYHFVSGTLEVSIVDNIYSLRLEVELDNEGGFFVGVFNGILDGMPIDGSAARF